MAVEDAVLAEWQAFFREAREGPPEWKRAGACFGLDPEMFHPGRGQTIEPAKRICEQCPVQGECLEYALSHFIKVGVWGGASERERRMIRRERHTAKMLGVELAEARAVVQAQLVQKRAEHVAQAPVRRLMRKFGYTTEQAEQVLARCHRSAVA